MDRNKISFQSEIFLKGEGDAWFKRNPIQKGLDGGDKCDVNFICDSLKSFKKDIKSILEIGCSSGEKLKILSDYFEASGFGIDPSEIAINEAKTGNVAGDSKLNFQVGLATNLPYEESSFDLVFFGFCLYLIPPSETYRAIAEANRVLKNGGFLAILDFDYGELRVNPYKHYEGLFSFKNNYSKFFLSSGYYSLVSKWSFSHSSSFFHLDRDQRISIEILYKESI